MLLIVSFSCASAETDKPQTFKNWQECFRFMANELGDMLPNQDDDTLFKLAAESSAETYWIKSPKIAIVIKLDYIEGSYSLIRGAQGNGAYYIFSPVENGYEFLGTLEGNSYKWQDSGSGGSKFITTWHWSADETGENIYDWDGHQYKKTSSKLYQYDSSGNRKEVK